MLRSDRISWVSVSQVGEHRASHAIYSHVHNSVWISPLHLIREEKNRVNQWLFSEKGNQSMAVLDVALRTYALFNMKSDWSEENELAKQNHDQKTNSNSLNHLMWLVRSASSVSRWWLLKQHRLTTRDALETACSIITGSTIRKRGVWWTCGFLWGMLRLHLCAWRPYAGHWCSKFIPSLVQEHTNSHVLIEIFFWAPAGLTFSWSCRGTCKRKKKKERNWVWKASNRCRR